MASPWINTQSRTGGPTGDVFHDPFRYTSERDLELSATLGQLGVYNFTPESGAKASKNLLENRSQEDQAFEHRQDMLDEPARLRIVEDLQVWQARKRVKTLLKKRAKDHLLEYLDRLRSQTRSDMGGENYITLLSQPGNGRLIEFVEEHGVPELIKLIPSGRSDDAAILAEQRRIAQICNRPIDIAKSLHVWFRLFDEICDKKMPLSRAIWLFKAINLALEKKRYEGQKVDNLRLHLFPKAVTELVMQWVTFTLFEPPRPVPNAATSAPSANQNPTAQGRRSQVVSPTQQDATKTGLRDRVDKWRRAASLVRWMFEEGLMRNALFFHDFIKLMRIAFGIVDSSPAASVSRPSFGAPSAANPAGGIPPSMRLSEKLQVLVLTEFASYVPHAADMGYAREIFPLLKQLLKVGIISQTPSLLAIVETCVTMCELKLSESPYMLDPFMKESRVEVAWDLSSLRYSKENLERLPAAVWDCFIAHNFSKPLVACVTLLEWAAASVDEVSDDNAYLAALGLEEAFLRGLCNVREVFDAFVDGLKPEDDSKVTKASWVLSFVLFRGVAEVDLTVNQKRTDRKTFLDVVARTEYSPPGCVNHPKSLSRREHERKWNEVMAKVFDANFQLDFDAVSQALSAIASPAERLRLLMILCENAPGWSLITTLLPFIENSFICRHLLVEPPTVKSNPVDGPSTTLECEEFSCRKLKAVLETRRDQLGELEARRLRDLFDSNGTAASTAGAFSSVQDSYQTTTSTSRQRGRNTVHMALAGILSDGPRKGPMAPTTKQTSSEAPDSLDLRSLRTQGWEGQRDRFDEGLQLINERWEKIANAIQKYVDTHKLGKTELFAFIRDVLASRTKEEREQICGWCVATMDTAEGIGAAVDFGLCRIEDVMNRWLPKKLLPKDDPQLTSLVKSKMLATQIQAHDPSVVRYAWFLHSSNAGSEFVKAFMRSWLPRGPALFKQPVDNVLDLILAAPTILRNEPEVFAAKAQPIFGDAMLFANLFWSLIPNPQDTTAVAQIALSNTLIHGMAHAPVAAAGVRLWKASDALCSIAQQQFFESVEPSVAVLLSRCLAKAQDLEEVRKRYVELASEAILQGANAKHEPLLMSVMGHAINGLPTKSVSGEKILKILGMVNPLQYRRIVIELVRALRGQDASFRKALAALIVSWKHRWPEHAGFFSLALRAVDGDPAETNPSLTENFVLCGEPSSSTGDIRFADAWAILEGARESDANYEFLRTATIRSSNRT